MSELLHGLVVVKKLGYPGRPWELPRPSFHILGLTSCAVHEEMVAGLLFLATLLAPVRRQLEDFVAQVVANCCVCS